ncbi:hypothetical protein O181_095170 [Austropuccinia psidii MF-1]|uniref:Uncharacterized protein n=1 Tax=Austropuccinia psidii MF-1 TaxID=1389203 RepID=A0A9Q3PBS6_9BASI|nr:hypothetical protein [Austropuccinia psidii MF-1]
MILKLKKLKTQKKGLSVHESDAEPSGEEELSDKLCIENINLSFEVTEAHTHIARYNDECIDLVHLQHTEMQKAKPGRGKGYTSGTSFITNIVIDNKAAKIHLNSGAF